MFIIQRILTRKRLLAQMRREEEEEEKKLQEQSRKADATKALALEDGAKRKATDQKQRRPKFPPRHLDARIGLNKLELQLFSEAKSVSVSLTLSLLQAKGLRTTWNKMNEISMNTGKGTVTLVQKALDKLQSKNDILRMIFYKTALLPLADGTTATTVHDHANYITIWIERVIDSINDAFQNRGGKNVSFHKKRIGKQRVTIELLIPAGEKHYQVRGAGLEPKHFDQLALYLIDEMFKKDCVRAYPDALAAWRIVIATLFDNIIGDLQRYRSPKREIGGVNEKIIEARSIKESVQAYTETEQSESQPQSSMGEVPWYKEWYV